MTMARGYYGPIWTSINGDRRVHLDYEGGDSEHLIVTIEVATTCGHWYELGVINFEGDDLKISEAIEVPDTLEFAPEDQSPRAFGPGTEKKGDLRGRIDRVVSLGIPLVDLYRQAGRTSLEEALVLAEAVVKGL
jgi:hypothetical protein